MTSATSSCTTAASSTCAETTGTADRPTAARRGRRPHRSRCRAADVRLRCRQTSRTCSSRSWAPSIFESDNGGQTWPVTYANPSRRRAASHSSRRTSARARTSTCGSATSACSAATCTTPNPANPGGAQRCAASGSWAGGFTRSNGAHDDSGSIAFVPGVASNACPAFFSSDGGVFRNTLNASPACQTPAWAQPTVTPHALVGLLVCGCVSARLGNRTPVHRQPGQRDLRCDQRRWCGRDLEQRAMLRRVRRQRRRHSRPDDGVLLRWRARDAPVHQRRGLSVARHRRSTRIRRATCDRSSSSKRSSSSPPIVRRRDARRVCSSRPTSAHRPSSGRSSAPRRRRERRAGCSFRTSGGNPTFFVKNGGCDGDRSASLFRTRRIGHERHLAAGATPGGTGGFGVFAVDPAIRAAHRLAPARLAATDHDGDHPERRHDVERAPALDGLMTGGGVFPYQNVSGPTSFASSADIRSRRWSRSIRWTLTSSSPAAPIPACSSAPTAAHAGSS